MLYTLHEDLLSVSNWLMVFIWKVSYALIAVLAACNQLLDSQNIFVSSEIRRR